MDEREEQIRRREHELSKKGRPAGSFFAVIDVVPHLETHQRS